MEKNRNSQYYSYLRRELVDLVEGTGNKVLEVGCGEGLTGGELKRAGKAEEVIGVEIFEPAALKAKERLDGVIVGDIQKVTLPYPARYFDYMIFGDVLEHLADPWGTLRRLKMYLSSSGFVIASIPNITYWEILKDLIFFDKWDYVDAGILDKTHLRFFTKKTLIDLFEKSGFKIEELMHHIPPRFTNKVGKIVSPRSLKRFFTAGYLIKAKIK